MSRLSIALVLLVGVLAGGLGVSLLDRRPAELDPAQVNALVEAYLMEDPSILQRMSDKLTAAQRTATQDAQKALLAANHELIYADAGNVILGNPDGDVTLVEMFDYNCGYCRNAVPDLAALMAEDPGLKVILKEFPILSDGSVEAAKVATLVNTDKSLDYWAFHQKLFASRGQVGAEAALAAAETVGGNRVAMMIDMNGKAAAAAIQQNYKLASALKISGTPTYIIGDELIPGAVGLDTLRGKIANMRACGSTTCPAPGG